MVDFFIVSKNPMNGEMFKYHFADKSTIKYGGQAYAATKITEMIKEEGPQLIFLEVDPNLIEINIQTIKRIKAYNPLAWIVCFSFADQLHLIRSILENGASGYLSSPIDRKQLNRIVEKFESETQKIDNKVYVNLELRSEEFFEKLANAVSTDFNHFCMLLPKDLLDESFSFSEQVSRYRKIGTELYYYIEKNKEQINDTFVILYNNYMLSLSRSKNLNDLMKAFYNFIKDYKYSSQEQKNNLSKNRIIQAKKMVDTLVEKGKPPSLDAIANQLFISPSYLSKTFKKEEKINFIDYVNNKRIEKAKVLLSTTDLTIDAIAYECGYEEPNSFRRFFKQREAMTPSEYRNQGS